MRSGAIKSAGRTGRHVPRRFCQSRDVLLKNSALGAKPEDQTEQKCAIAYVGIFMAPSHWPAAAPGHAGQRTTDPSLEAAVEIGWTHGPKWVDGGRSDSGCRHSSDVKLLWRTSLSVRCFIGRLDLPLDLDLPVGTSYRQAALAPISHIHPMRCDCCNHVL